MEGEKLMIRTKKNGKRNSEKFEKNLQYVSEKDWSSRRRKTRRPQEFWFFFSLVTYRDILEI